MLFYYIYSWLFRLMQNDFTSSIVDISFTFILSFPIIFCGSSWNILLFLKNFALFSYLQIGWVFSWNFGFSFSYQLLLFHISFLFFLISSFSLWYIYLFHQVWIFLFCILQLLFVYPFGLLISFSTELIAEVVKYIISLKSVRFGLKSFRRFLLQSLPTLSSLGCFFKIIFKVSMSFLFFVTLVSSLIIFCFISWVLILFSVVQFHFIWYQQLSAFFILFQHQLSCWS